MSKATGSIVIVKVMTIFDMEELEDIIAELMACCNKPSEYHGKVFDCFIFTSNLYLVLEYFENGSLMDLVGPADPR